MARVRLLRRGRFTEFDLFVPPGRGVSCNDGELASVGGSHTKLIFVLVVGPPVIRTVQKSSSEKRSKVALIAPREEMRPLQSALRREIGWEVDIDAAAASITRSDDGNNRSRHVLRDQQNPHRPKIVVEVDRDLANLGSLKFEV